MLTTLLFLQHTAWALQEFPVATPMTVMGEQVIPTRASMLWTLMPRRARRSDVAGSFAYRKNSLRVSYVVARSSGDTNLLDAVAALEGPGRTLAGGTSVEGGGGRKEGQGPEDEGGEARGNHGDEGE